SFVTDARTVLPQCHYTQGRVERQAGDFRGSGRSRFSLKQTARVVVATRAVVSGHPLFWSERGSTPLSHSSYFPPPLLEGGEICLAFRVCCPPCCALAAMPHWHAATGTTWRARATCSWW